MLDREIIVREIQRLKAHLYRAEKLELPATLTLDEWFCILDRYEWRCAYCTGPFEVLEHYIPMGMGGGTTYDNCRPACRCCNVSKKDRHPFEWDKREREKFERNNSQERKLAKLKLPIVTNLAHIRIQLNLQQIELAYKCKIHFGTYMKAERGKPTTYKTALQIIAATNIALTEAGYSQVTLEDLGLTIK